MRVEHLRKRLAHVKWNRSKILSKYWRTVWQHNTYPMLPYSVERFLYTGARKNCEFSFYKNRKGSFPSFPEEMAIVRMTPQSFFPSPESWLSESLICHYSKNTHKTCTKHSSTFWHLAHENEDKDIPSLSWLAIAAEERTEQKFWSFNHPYVFPDTYRDRRIRIQTDTRKQVSVSILREVWPLQCD